jgi:hypothetical protein
VTSEPDPVLRVTIEGSSTRDPKRKQHEAPEDEAILLYIGVTNNLQRRMYEHQHHLVAGFTSTYHMTCLVYFEETSDVYAAIAREKQLKGWVR